MLEPITLIQQAINLFVLLILITLAIWATLQVIEAITIKWDIKKHPEDYLTDDEFLEQIAKCIAIRNYTTNTDEYNIEDAALIYDRMMYEIVHDLTPDDGSTSDLKTVDVCYAYKDCPAMEFAEYVEELKTDIVNAFRSH